MFIEVAGYDVALVLIGAAALGAAILPPSSVEIWALVGFVVVLSIVLHGVTATPAMQRIDDARTDAGG